MTGLALAALLAIGTADPELLRPDSVLRPAGGPTIALVHAQGSDGVSIRLSIPFVEGHADAGAGNLLQLLTMQRIRPLREQIGAQVEATRTPWGLAYSVSGSSADFAHLAWIVRRILARPGTSGWGPARARVRAAIERERETPRHALSLELRSLVAPSLPPLAGTPSSLDVLNHARLVELWAASHHRSNLSFVVVGAVPVEAVLANLLEVGMVGPAPMPPRSPRGGVENDPPRPEQIRTWYGEAYQSSRGDDPRAAVAALLMGGRLEGVGNAYEAWVERWELGPGSTLVVAGAAYRRGAPAMRTRIQGLRVEIGETLTEVEVRSAAAAVRVELVVRARSLLGLANLIGWHMDASGDPEGASDYLARLAQIDRAAMEAFFRDLATSQALIAELPS